MLKLDVEGTTFFYYSPVTVLRIHHMTISSLEIMLL